MGVTQNQGAQSGPAGEMVITQSESLTAPAATPATRGDAIRAMRDGSRAFAIDLYRTLAAASPRSNLFFSPYSVSLALTTAYEGARGETASEIAQTLHLSSQGRDPHAQVALFASGARELANRQQRVQSSPTDENAFQLSIANSVWTQNGVPILPKYKAAVEQGFNSTIQQTNYIDDPASSRTAINQWVGKKTQQRITELIPAGGVDPSTRMVLANAVYFKAGWANRFDADSTYQAEFTSANGAKSSVSMMHQRERFLYARGEQFQAIELPYRGNVAMLVVLPEEGAFDQVEASLDAKTLDAITSSLVSRRVDLNMPKFASGGEVALSNAVKQLGIERAFAQNADFSGMSQQGAFALKEVFHKGTITVDEEGTEAAAATGTTMRATAAYKDTKAVVTVQVDRPFITAIIDKATGTILFLGRIATI